MASGSDGVYDLSIKLGGLVGVIGSAEANDGKTNSAGGIILAASFARDHTEYLTSFVEPQIVVDLSGLSVLRKGAGAGIMYHLLGGPRRIFSEHFLAQKISGTNYNVSMFYRVGYYAYTARDLSSRSEPVTGSILENLLGLNLGFNLFEGSILGLEVGGTVISFATSIERVSSNTVETSLFWRVLF